MSDLAEFDAQEYWNLYYQTFNEFNPSPFCTYVIENFVKENDAVVELGCGNGRDGLSLVESSAFYQGIDVSEQAILRAQHLFESHGITQNKYALEMGNFAEVQRPELPTGTRIIVYSRFSLHADSEDAQQELFTQLNSILYPGDLILVEVRTIHDELFGIGEKVGRNAYVTDHFRRFLDPDDFPAVLPESFGLKSKKVERGFAPYEGADPIVMRLEIEVTNGP
jgi:SAM-dependent methyltransferase